MDLNRYQIKKFYKILGVDEHADESKVKLAYRKLALKYHPDQNQGDAGCEEKTKQLNEAYTFLIKHIKTRVDTPFSPPEESTSGVNPIEFDYTDRTKSRSRKKTEWFDWYRNRGKFIKTELMQILENGTFQIRFKTVSGLEKLMVGTLIKKYLPSDNDPEINAYDEQTRGLLWVWDLEKKKWRGIQASCVLEISEVDNEAF